MITSKSSTSEKVTIKVELFGTARIACGIKTVDMIVPPDTSTGEIVKTLAEVCPQLVGSIILGDISGLKESHIFNLNGTSFVSEDQIQLRQGDTLLLFSSQAGG